MKKLGLCAAALAAASVLSLAGQRPATISIDYPENDSIFPPDIIAPTFLWRDPAPSAKLWRIDVVFADGGASIRADSKGERLRIGEIDPRVVSDTNRPPELTPQQAAARTWTPDPETWATIKKRSVEHPATIEITGFADPERAQPVSSGSLVIQTSKDPVSAPIFYRDVPLMPSELEKGVIKPLAQAAVPLIAWRLRNVSEPKSRLLMTGLHTCANCHSFSRDGKTLGMDLDGPRNDKGMYTLVNLAPKTAIRNEDVIEWSSFQGKLTGDSRIGFMSQVSPDSQYVVTTIKGPEPAPSRNAAASNYYVANFKDYRFLQVFYPTSGILAWYSRATGKLTPLPGADDPGYVQASAVWSPDGKYLIFVRTEARDAYAPGRPIAERANDPNETPMQYNLYRIPFNNGKGGQAEPIRGASNNGMSNSFPKVSPDGRWIIFVKARNGLLMRPDSKLYIVPAAGGEARPLRSNLPLMNSWHSFSPNGRWLVFSSKTRSPYTQMYLTHLDEEGNASPAILIDNATAANRAVNIPEFVNIPPDGLQKIDVPAVEYYRLYDLAWEMGEKGQYEAAVAGWKKALALSSEDPKAHVNLGAALVRTGKISEGIAEYQVALKLKPDYPEAHNNYGIALAATGKLQEAKAHYETALKLKPEFAEAHNDLGLALAEAGKLDEAIAHYGQALQINPRYAEVHNNLGIAFAKSGKTDEAVAHYQKAIELNPRYAEAHYNLGQALAGARKMDEAIGQFHQALEIDPNSADVHESLALALAGAGKVAEAVPHLVKVAELNPGSAEAHNMLGLALAGTGKPDEAIAQFAQAVKLNPGFTEAHYNLGSSLYFMKGKVPEAVAEWRLVLRADPNHLLVLDQTARALATSPDAAVRNGADAVTLAERAAKLSGGREPAILDTLAAAYAEAGRFPDAVTTARRALSLAEQASQPKLVDALKGRLALYQANRPYHTGH